MLGIPKLDAFDLGGGFDRNKGALLIGDREYAAHGLFFRGVARASAGGAVNAYERNVAFEDESSIDGVGFVGRRHEQGCAPYGSPINGFL